jgi:hypothetical protein
MLGGSVNTAARLIRSTPKHASIVLRVEIKHPLLPPKDAHIAAKRTQLLKTNASAVGRFFYSVLSETNGYRR